MPSSKLGGDSPLVAHAQRKQFLANGKCGNCGTRPPISNRKYCNTCQTSQLSCSKLAYAETKKIIFDFFGNKCACCGEVEPKFLTVDHINNDGHIRRKGDHNGGSNFYKSVVRAIRSGKPPEDLQLLCRNCNWGKHANGGICPHVSKYL